MPKLLRLRFCNIGPHRARMEDLTLRLEDITSGQATHSAIFLRNGGGKTTLISLIFWLLCPDKPMPDKNQIADYVRPEDHSVIVAEWQMDQPPSLWTGKPERYLTGVFCEWRPASSQEGRKLQHFFFATRVIDDEPRLSLEHLPILVLKQGQYERRNLFSFRQEWRELDHTYPQAEIESTETFIAWREILERIGIDPELFRYQIRMNTREGGAAEPFMFKENEQFVNFFLELMGEAATGNAIAGNIQDFRTKLFDLRQRFDPEYQLLQTLIQQLTALCEVADERAHLYHQMRSTHKEISGMTLAVTQWMENWQRGLDTWQRSEQQAHEEYLRQKEAAGQYKRQALLLRHTAAQKRVQQIQTEVKTYETLVREKKRQVVIWQAAIPLRSVNRARAKAEGIEKQLRQLFQEHEPLLRMLQESARFYAAALTDKVDRLREEERRLKEMAHQQRTQAQQLRGQETDQRMKAQGADAQADILAGKLQTFRTLQKKMLDQGIMLPGERWEDAQHRLLQQQATWQKEQNTLEEAIEALEQEQQDLQGELNDLQAALSRLEAQIETEQDALGHAQEARGQIANDVVLQQYLEVTDLDFDRLTPQALDMLKQERSSAEERIAQLRLSLAEQEAIITYLADHGFLPPAQTVTQVIELLQKEHLIAWSGWQYLTESIREADRRSWLQRLPELAFGVVLPDEHWEQARQILQTTPPYLETPVVIFARRGIQEDTPVRGWTIGPTSDAYFNTTAGNSELLDRQERYQQQQQLLDERISNTTALKHSIDRLEQTFAYYSTSWWEQHQQTLAEAQKQKSSIETQQRTQKQALQYCGAQIAQRKQELGQLRKKLQDVSNGLIQLQAYEDQLAIDADTLQEKEHQQRMQANRHSDEAQKLRDQAASKDQEANNIAEAEKRVAGDAKVTESERNKVEYLEGESPAACPGDIPVLRDQYESLRDQYRQKIGARELQNGYDNALKEEREAYQQFEKKLQKPVSEWEVQAALSTLTDPDEADDRAEKAVNEKFTAERERDEKRKELSLAEEDMQSKKNELIAQGIDENEGWDSFPESEEHCTEEAEKKEQLAASSEQAARQQREAEQTAQENIKECNLKIEGLRHVQHRIRTMQQSYAPLLSAAVVPASVTNRAESDSTTPSEEEQTAFQEVGIDDTLRVLEDRLHHMQQEKKGLDDRSEQGSKVIVRALNEVSREFKEVTLAKSLLAYEEDAYEQHCQMFLSQMHNRLQWVQREREKLQEYRGTLVQNLLALAEAGIAFLNSATKYSKLPATLPDFGQRPFLRIHLTDPASNEERVGRIADFLDTLVKDKDQAIPSGIQLLQRAVHRLASPINVQILFPDPAALHYVAPASMMKESGGERLTSMVLLYCTLLRMRAAHRTKPAGKSSCLILDNPIGVASRAMFLELQREVAQAMDIQLIYTTAIKDFDALHIFPNVIRVRNDQRDRRTGDQLLALDTSSAELEALRIMHSESRDFAHEHQERLQ